MADWQISKTHGQCSGTGEPFQDGEDYYSALVEGAEGLERCDFSIAYWDEHEPKTFCFWKTKMVAEEQKKKLLVNDEMLMSFFERLAEETDQEKVYFRFVLTLILMRKRKLKYDSSEIVDGSEVWTLRVTGQSRNVQVVNPNLTEDQIEQLSSQMGQILQVDL